MIHPFCNMRIRNKLFIAYSCAFLLAFAVAGGIIYFQVKDIIQSGIEKDLTKTTETILSVVSTTAEVSIKNYMRAVAEKNYDIVHHFHRQVLRGRLTEEEAKKQASEVILSQTIGKTGRNYCLDSNGIMVVHPKRSLLGVDVSGLPFVKEQIQRKKGYMEYEWKEPLETETRPKAISMLYFEPWDWIISASTYRDEFDKLVDIEDVSKRIRNLGFGKSGYPYVLNYDGELIIHPHLEGKHYSEFGDSRLSKVAKHIVNKKNGKYEYLWRNPGEDEFRSKTVYFNDIPDMKWIVASSIYHEDFYGPLNAIGYVIMSSLAIALLLLIPISIGIGSLISRPLKDLQYNFAKAADGDFSVRMSQHSKDELGILGGYFNSFMEKLTTYSNDLRTEIAVRNKAEKKLIAMDKAKTMFLSSASHELRTPLTSIIGFLKLMDKNFKNQFLPHLEPIEELQPRTKRFVENLHIVQSEAGRLGRLVNDLLDLSKIESGKMDWRDQQLSVETILKNAAEVISGHAAENPNVEFVLEIPSNMPSLYADEDRLHQVLINLLNNALKYTDQGTVTLTATRTQSDVEFTVCDTGRGIPEADLARVFDIFYQVQDENMRSSKVFGTGLGLAICQQIAHHYHGDISVDSAIGQGSCFIFSIPFSKETPSES